MSSGRQSFLLGLLILAATVCLVLGLTLPILRLTRFYIWTDVHSLVSVVWELYASGEVVLACIIALFSIIFPFLKLLHLLTIYSIRQVRPPDRPSRWLQRLSWLGKWSMLDVLVLALLIFYAKAMNLADAMSMPGIYLFAASVILTMFATAIIENDLKDGDGRLDERDQLRLVPPNVTLEGDNRHMPSVFESPNAQS
jgi:paraquat-inducible protein A